MQTTSPPLSISTPTSVVTHSIDTEDEQLQRIVKHLLLLTYCTNQQVLLSSLTDLQQQSILEHFEIQQAKACSTFLKQHSELSSHFDISNLIELVIQYGTKWDILASLLSSTPEHVKDAFLDQATIQIQNFKLLQESLLPQQQSNVTPYMSPYINAQEHLLDNYPTTTPHTPTLEDDNLYDYKPTNDTQEDSVTRKCNTNTAQQNIMSLFAQQQEALEWELRRETRTKHFIIRLTVCMLITVSYFCFCFMTCFFVLCLYLLFR